MTDVRFEEKLVKPLVRSRDHYDNGGGKMIGQEQKEKCKYWHFFILPKEEKNFFFVIVIWLLNGILLTR